MKRFTTSKIQKFLTSHMKAVLSLSFLFFAGFVSAQSPYCNAPNSSQGSTCSMYNMSINGVDIKQGGTSLYYRAHGNGYNTYGCSGSTGDYTLYEGAGSTPLFAFKAGASYSAGFTTGNQYNVNIFIWIDLNGDKDFSDANEYITPAGTTSPQCNTSGVVPYNSSTFTYYSFKIPASVTPGTTRMRIRSTYYGMGCFTTADVGCSDFAYGECEDYTISLVSNANDAAVSSVTAGACSPGIKADIVNLGTNDITSLKVGWSVNGSYQLENSYSSTLTKQGGKTTITLKNAGNTDYNFVDGNTYTLKVFTYLPNNTTDADKTDDTTTIKFTYVAPPVDAAPKDVTRCGGGTVKLNAGVPKGTLAMWFNSSTSNTLLAVDTVYNTPFLYPGNYTYYVQSAKVGNKVTLSNATIAAYWWGNTNPSGVMFDLIPNKTLILDSVSVNVNSGNIMDADVYIKTGTYSGYQSQPSAWTLIKSVKGIKAKSLGNPTVINLGNYVLPVGTYGMYVMITDGVTFNITANTVTTADLTFSAGSALIGNFASGGYGTNYSSITNVYYRPLLCTGNRMPAKVTVKPAPYGAGFTKGTPYQSTQPNTLGVLTNPDIVAKGDQITWNLTPPTGYNNADYGSKWLAANPVVRSKKGGILTGLWTWTAPSGSTPGKFTFNPDKTVVDSFYTVSLLIRDLGPHFCDSTITRSIFVAPRPEPNFKFNAPVCDGDAVLFDDDSKISSGGLAWKYKFNTGNAADTATTNSAVFTFPKFGTYTVTLITKSTPYGYIDSISIPVVVTEIPKIGFKVSNACEKVAVSFNNTTTIGSGTITYAWDFGDGTGKSTSKNPTYIYKNAGAYKVTLKATASGCTSELTKNANQFATPKASFDIPTGSICDKSDVLFTNTSTIKMGNMGYTWNFGDGGISNFASPIHQFTNFSTKQVKMKAVSEFGCMDSATKPVVLVEAPNADFIWGAACNLTNTDFTFTGTKPAGAITTFNWDFGTSTTGVENPSKLFDIVGIRPVTLTLYSNNGCTDIVTKDVNVKLQSKADFKVGDVCEDDDAVFINSSSVSQGNLLYNWKFGDNTKSTSQSPRHRYTINGVSQTFNVTLVAVVPGGCSDSINIPVSVNAKPKSDFTFTTSGRKVIFKPNQSGNTIYQWRFGDGGSSTNSNPTYDYLAFANGKYQACLAVVNAANCFSESCKEVSITGSVDNITKLSGVKVYPNPNKGSFTVTVEDPKSDISIAVYNLLGEVVKTIETNPLKATYSIDMNVANGVYLVKVTNGGLTSTQKVTINR